MAVVEVVAARSFEYCFVCFSGAEVCACRFWYHIETRYMELLKNK